MKPNEEMHHKQSIYHFEGGEDLLNKIANELLGVNLSDLPFRTWNN